MDMNDILPPGSLLTAFVIASVVLAVTPGPAVLYIVTRSLVQGRRSGLASVAGVALGNLGNAIGASVGLAALFAVSSLAFAAVKYAGAIYLIYLGVQAMSAPRSDDASPHPRGARPWRLFGDGFIVALLNPKTAMFFAAFLPQFMSAETAPALQGVALGVLFVAIAATTDTAYALLAGAVGPALGRARGVRSLGRYLTGGGFIGLGVFTALSGSRGAK
jgi:threonine/homoserine/homoserine lactone efflux protein